MARVDTIRWVRINVSGQLDGATVIPAQSKPLERSDNNMIVIDVGNLGVISPSFDGAGSGAKDDWILRYFRVVMPGVGGPDGSVDVVSNASFRVHWNVGTLNGVSVMQFDGTRGIMPGETIKIDDDTDQDGHTVWLGLFEIETTGDAIRATS